MTRLDELRALFDRYEIDAFYVPKFDEYMGEYIRPCDERLEWISGFKGSAGYAVITRERAGLFVDSRYSFQAKAEAPEFEIIGIPENDLADWLADERLGFDANLLTCKQAENWGKALGDRFVAVPNLIDEIWQGRPASQDYQLRELPMDLAGVSTKDKLEKICAVLREKSLAGFVSNNPESIAWLLNIRGGEIAMLPAPVGYMIVHEDGRLDIFGVQKPDFELPADFYPLEALDDALSGFAGKLGVNANALPFGRAQKIKDAKPIADPIMAAKACKNPAEIKASISAHDADGIAMIKFLAWLDGQDPTTLDEIKCAERLLAFRCENADFRVESFGAISAWNGNAANAHYHATPENFAHFGADGVYLLDSGGHYPGATTDITRTIAIGAGIDAAKAPYTEVLNGLAMISGAKFPKGKAGRDIDALARMSLWSSGRNYGHGTGHGVGAELSVHEGPASISPRGEVPLEKGMIMSLEPGFYLEGQFGIRLENLGLVAGDDEFYHFETLSFVPIDTRLIAPASLAPEARNWLNEYHKNTFEKHARNVNETVKNWLKSATVTI